ncbi:unnamed protein product [Prorocentrum cordatum]|uniref:WW domain-containing protein n=1 Tax=Prorocentrum cordatum TaxID=2364126 RepID=A0ABN9UH24_9DINO|nr:unnamed protein product [Polarella glacialis]
MAEEGGEEPDEKEELAWERAMVKMVALRGDPDAEAFILQKHPEIASCAVPLDMATGTPMVASDGTTAAEARENWFKKRLRNKCFDHRERRKLCKQLLKALLRYAEKYEAPKDGAVSAFEALKDGGAQEGPVVCHRLHAGIAGSKFEGLRIAREKPGIYQLGPKLRVAVQAELEGDRLLVHGYFDGDVLHPVRTPVLPFLEEHGAAPAADAGCDLFGGGAAAPGGDDAAAAGAEKRRRELPPGWAKKESRSKPGVFYYVNEAKGLSQFNRPEE